MSIYKNIEKTADCKILMENLFGAVLNEIDTILGAYDDNRIDFIEPRTKDDEPDFDGEYKVVINDESYFPYGTELLVMKWVEGRESTEFLIECFNTTLENINTSYEPRKVVMYNSRGDKPVMHNKNVRKIFENIYMGEIIEDSYYQKYCLIYAIYGENLGFYIGKVRTTYFVTDVHKMVNRNNVATLDSFMENINNRIAKGQWINLVEMEFVKSIKPELVTAMENARAAHKARIEAENKARKEEYLAKEKAKMEKENAESFDKIYAAIEVIKTGGKIENDDVTIWTDVEHYHNYAVFGYLFDKYGIDVPIKTRGFINNSLVSVTISAEGGVSYSYWRKGKSKGSQKIYDLMYELIRKIRNESED